MNLYSAKEMTELLKRHDFFFKKNLGQNFLINEAIASRIAASARESMPGGNPCLAVEIGPGAGALTLPLSQSFDRVLAVEIDPHLIGVLEESLASCKNVTVVNADALKFDFAAAAREYEGFDLAVCSNLPYYLTSEILMRLLESALPLKSVTVLIQKEAAARLTSGPGEEAYGAIAAAVSYYAKAKRLFGVGPGNFIPRPKVDSAVLQLIPYPTPRVKVSDEALFFKLIRAAFSNRRKTLSNALSAHFSESLSREELPAILKEAGVDPARRGETLTLEEFAAVTDILKKREEY